MAEFHFLRPLWLFGLLPLTGVLLWSLRQRQQGDPWRPLVDPHLLRRLRPAAAGAGRRRLIWPGIAGVLALLALAGPSWERVPPPAFRSATPPLLIVLDLSRSMTATDLSPDRLAVARSALHALLERLPPRETGLVVFAGGAHRVMPLTWDRRLIQDLLPRLDPALMPVPGSNPAAGLALATALLQQAGATAGDVLLVTDGTDEEAQASAGALQQAGYRLLVLGFGTPAGGRIPDPDQGPAGSGGGPPLLPLDDTALTGLGRAGGGLYLRWNGAGETLPRLLRAVAPARAGEAVKPGTGSRGWLDRGPWLLLPLLLLAVTGFRRGLLGLWLLPLLLPPQPVAAAQWQELWLNRDQRARVLLDQGHYRQAAQLFRDPRWRGVALYLAGDYAAAADSFGRADDALAHYDRGNALLRLGRTREAVAAYQEALKRKPDYDRARRNLDLARRLLATPQEEPAPPLSLPRPPQAKPGRARGGERPQGRESPAPAAEPPPSAGQRRAQPPPPTGDGRGGSGGRRSSAASRGESAGSSGAAARPEPSPAGRSDAPRPRGAPAESGMAPERQAAPPPRAAGKGVPPAARSAAPPPPAGTPAAAGATAQEPPVSRGDTAPGQGRPGTAPPQSPPPAGRIPDRGGAPRRGTEQEQAVRNWLQRVPDEPAGLLRELFRREHQRGRDMSRQGDPW